MYEIKCARADRKKLFSIPSDRSSESTSAGCCPVLKAQSVRFQPASPVQNSFQGSTEESVLSLEAALFQTFHSSLCIRE